jgi:hypothetical protein
MENDILIVANVKYLLDDSKTSENSEPDWEKLGIERPKSESNKTHLWRRKAFLASSVMDLTELEEGLTGVTTYDDSTFIIQMEFTAAIKAIFKVEY